MTPTSLVAVVAPRTGKIIKNRTIPFLHLSFKPNPTAFPLHRYIDTRSILLTLCVLFTCFDQNSVTRILSYQLDVVSSLYLQFFILF